MLFILQNFVNYAIHLGRSNLTMKRHLELKSLNHVMTPSFKMTYTYIFRLNLNATHKNTTEVER